MYRKFSLCKLLCKVKDYIEYDHISYDSPLFFIRVLLDFDILFLFLISNFTFYGLNEMEVAKCTI